MKIFHWFLVALVALTICLEVYIDCNKKEMRMDGTVVEKYTTFDRNGSNLHYHIIIRYADGVVEDDCHSVEFYASVQTGKSYSFKVSR